MLPLPWMRSIAPTGAEFVAALIRLLGDFVAAVDQWPASGVPEFPRAWIIQTARHKAIAARHTRGSFAAVGNVSRCLR